MTARKITFWTFVYIAIFALGYKLTESYNLQEQCYEACDGNVLDSTSDSCVCATDSYIVLRKDIKP